MYWSSHCIVCFSCIVYIRVQTSRVRTISLRLYSYEKRFLSDSKTIEKIDHFLYVVAKKYSKIDYKDLLVTK